MEIPTLPALPFEADSLAESYDVIIDALFGFSFKPPARPQFADILETLRLIQERLPIFSVDVPSGR